MSPARPPPSRAVAELAVFLAGQPLVGHNVAFDLAFLAEAGLHVEAPAFDTLELASVLLPTATQLDLSSLAATLAVEVSQRHRALPDAEATGAVLLRLLDRLEALPLATLRDLVRLAEQSGWGLGALFDDALARRDGGGSCPTTRPRRARAGSEPAPPSPLPAPLRPREGGYAPVTEADLERVFDEASRRADLLPDFEARTGQLAMARAVAGNIAHHGHLAVEAGTGTGKSLAYLVPALLHALRSGERVVVSTQTLNLQEQLGERDLPAAAALVEAAEGAPVGALRSAVLKGRANYLCLERWTQALEAESERSVEQARLLARVAVWLDETESGDVAELYLRSEDRPHWRALAADTNDCLARRCPFVREGSCFLQRSRARAAAAHVRRRQPRVAACQRRERRSGAAALPPPRDRRGAAPRGGGDRSVRRLAVAVRAGAVPSTRWPPAVAAPRRLRRGCARRRRSIRCRSRRRRASPPSPTT